MIFDYIITGSGCAGLSLAMRMACEQALKGKRIVLIDKELKIKNDRTWCFWETMPGLFEPIIYKSWSQAWFYSDAYSRLLHLAPYTYKLIRGIDFYTYCLQTLQQHPNISVITGEVETIESNAQETYAVVNGQKIYGTYIFNSILFDKPVLQKNEYYLLQHFKGVVIETAQPVFNPAEATLMDFRAGQQHGLAFSYIMPFSEKRALVEYTLFTKQLLQQTEYENRLHEYISRFVTNTSYEVKEEEFGVIPMTNHRFATGAGNIINIGTAGGQTKASSGYTFQFIQKHTAAIVKQLVVTGKPEKISRGKDRFHFYDSILLHILYHRNDFGKKVFTDLFKKNNPVSILRFLDNDSSWLEELKIISSLPAWPFLKAAVRIKS